MQEKILFPDNIHFHKKNFKSLMELVDINEVEPVFIKEYNELKALYGNYEQYKTTLLKYYDEIRTLTKEELYNYTYFGASIFALAKAELLTYLMPRENWYSCDISCDSEWIFNKAFKQNKEALLLNMSVALFWLDFWRDVLAKQKGITLCAIFSGSLIYVKTLNYLLQNTPIRVFVLEHFFTGNDYYFEEKYTHISNNSDIKFANVYNKLIHEYNLQDEITKNKERVKAVNKLLLAKNKNVKQPDQILTEFNLFNSCKPILLILGQVINDFSIVETKIQNINSLQVYKKIIKQVLQKTDYNIIFKAHPWERQKNNIKRALTKEILSDFIFNEIDRKLQKRIVIVEDYNLQTLIENSSIIVAFSSQSLLEAAYMGKKPCQIGDAFFGKKGFTYDFENETAFIDFICKDSIQENLTIDEYEKLILFFTLIFQYHLVSVNDSGKLSIRKKTSKAQHIEVIKDNKDMELLPSKELQFVEPERAKEEKMNIDGIGDQASLKKKIIENLVIAISSENKIKKFKSNPKKFFEDSEFWVVRQVGKIY